MEVEMSDRDFRDAPAGGLGVERGLGGAADALARGGPRAQLVFLATALRNNLASAIEYRTSFVTQLVGMLINDSLWVLFWALYFERFPVLKGWQREDLFLMWGVITFAFGIAFGLFAQVLRLAELIAAGQLDYYLALPKNVLLQIMCGQVRPANLGDLLFGPLLLLLFVPLSAEQWLWYFVASSLAAFVYLGFFILAGSLAFFLGSSEALANGIGMTLIHFSTYPSRIFSGGTRVILFTLIPAAFIAEVPVDLVRRFSWSDLSLMFAGGVGFFAIGAAVFHFGLRRYESGNMLVLRS
jgi:ABC-2 type transport system permease protein